MRKILTMMLSCALLGSQAQSRVAASIFCESFDATMDIAGNDGLKSSSSSNKLPVYDNDGWVRSGDNNLSAAAQCVRLGTTSGSVQVTLTSPSIAISGSSLLLKYRAMAMNNSKSTALYVNNGKQTISSEWSNYTKSLSKDGSTIQIVFTTKKDNSEKNSYFALDNVVLYQNDATDAQQQQAAMLILTGTWEAEDVASLNANLAENDKVVFIDATEATFADGSSVITPGNANCLIHIAAGKTLGNSSNVIVDDVCENLVLHDGSPFHSEVAFTAENVSYDRTFAGTGGYISTSCLPFAIDKSKWPGINGLYTFTSFSKPDITFTSQESIVSNQPCLISVKEAQPFSQPTHVDAAVSPSFNTSSTQEALFVSFAGVFSEYELLSAAESDGTTALCRYGFVGNQFYELPDSDPKALLKPFRAIFNVQKQFAGAASKSYGLSLVGGTTSVASVEASSSNRADIYDMEGRLVVRNAGTQDLKHLKNGLYVVGKKIIFVK